MAEFGRYLTISWSQPAHRPNSHGWHRKAAEAAIRSTGVIRNASRGRGEGMAGSVTPPVG
ncbi:hypothetical protein [Streptomyces sp. B8F3]|uniref:hypothetical protein n=1 Tax=unclassified Streptomyces TaxID=2593676 RepID=UPI00325C69BE